MRATRCIVSVHVYIGTSANMRSAAAVLLSLPAVAAFAPAAGFAPASTFIKATTCARPGKSDMDRPHTYIYI